MMPGLSGVQAPWARYLVLGGGKTGIDAVLHLLGHGVREERLWWVVPQDAWFWTR